MAKTKQVKGRLTSIQYVHDPEAANEWMKLLMEITKKQFSERCLNKDKG